MLRSKALLVVLVSMLGMAGAPTGPRWKGVGLWELGKAPAGSKATEKHGAFTVCKAGAEEVDFAGLKWTMKEALAENGKVISITFMAPDSFVSMEAYEQVAEVLDKELGQPRSETKPAAANSSNSKQVRAEWTHGAVVNLTFSYFKPLAGGVSRRALVLEWNATLPETIRRRFLATAK